MRGTRSDPDSLINAGRWLHRQLPIRFARRIEEFLRLPHVVVCNPHIGEVMTAYLETFDAVSSFREIQTLQDENEFCQLISRQAMVHGPDTQLLAEGYREVRQLYPEIRLDNFLNKLFTARIASRILMENYIEMRDPQEGSIGVVRQGMHPLELVRAVEGPLTELTLALYGESPALEYRGNPNCRLDYIPRHVGYMLRELLKNAMRATVERHSNRQPRTPPVIVELQQGDVHVIIKISDQGGGIPKRIQQEVWQYGWSTSEGEEDVSPFLHAEGALPSEPPVAGRRAKKELAGYGFGLPLTRLHAQYFGGDVFMQALPGHGTDMYLLLTHLKEGTDSTEVEDLSSTLYQTEAASFDEVLLEGGGGEAGG